MRVYLDTCCLNRPFDGQGQARVRLEAEAIRTIFSLADAGRYEWVSSEVLALEVARTPDLSQRAQVERILGRSSSAVRVDSRVRRRAKHLETMGFGAFDALHIACAEQARSDVMLTTDDKFLRRAEKLAGQLEVRVANPLAWLGEELSR
jgi:predicted nucleic acid-binding protein